MTKLIKYLCMIIFGILLFIINNSKNRFSVGIPEYKFELIEGKIVSEEMSDTQMWTDEDHIYDMDLEDEEIYYVWAKDIKEAERKFKRYNSLNGSGVDIVNINIPTNVVGVNSDDEKDVTCEPNYSCVIVNDDIDGDTSWMDCEPAYLHILRNKKDMENCRRYHDINYCVQNCSFVNVNDASKTLTIDGFQKYPGLVNVDITENVDDMNKDFRTFYYTDRDAISPPYSESGFLYSEYLFKMLIEKNLNSNLHRIDNGIYYINGKIILCRFDNGNVRVSSFITTEWTELDETQQEAARILRWNQLRWDKFDGRRLLSPIWAELDETQQEAAHILGWTEETWGHPHPYSHYFKSFRRPFPLLHMDFQKYITYDSRDYPYGSADSPVNALRALFGSDYPPSIDEKTSKYHFVKTYINGIQFISNDNSTSINLWLLLHGSPGIKTMGFIDIIDDDDPGKYNAETLKDMQGSDIAIQKDDSNNYSMEEFPGRLTNYFQKNSVQFPNVLEIKTTDTDNPEKPNINPNILYNYDMSPGDVLAFRSDIPHIGFTDDRVSVEYRYDYIEVDLQPFEEIFRFQGTANDGPRLLVNLDKIGELLSEFTDSDLTKELDKIEAFFKTINLTLLRQYNAKFNKQLSDTTLFLKFLNYLNNQSTINFNNINHEGKGPLGDPEMMMLSAYADDFLQTI